VSTDQQIESEIQAKGLTAPRVTPADLAANIASAHYFTAFDGAQLGQYGGISTDAPGAIPALSLLTFCVLVLRNGFTVTGESACASPENFDAEVGRKIAFENAKQKMWPLMGYALRERLAGPSPEAVSRFLAWPLPKDFYPNCGISFDGRKDDEWNKNKTWPIGTNLLTAEQATAMLKHVLG
jgi:hypothetical protein